jgi:hypothetical protein
LRLPFAVPIDALDHLEANGRDPDLCQLGHPLFALAVEGDQLRLLRVEGAMTCRVGAWPLFEPFSDPSARVRPDEQRQMLQDTLLRELGRHGLAVTNASLLQL